MYMNDELINQYAHTWKIFSRLVTGFGDDSWLLAGRGAHTPARLSWHILNGVQFYIEDTTVTLSTSEKLFDWNPKAAPENTLPSQTEVLSCIAELRVATSTWLSGLEPDVENEMFPWTGETRFSVAIFLLRHTDFHIGELSMLLNESRDGDAGDSWLEAME